MKAQRINLAIPQSLFVQLKDLSKSRSTTMTEYIRQTLFIRVDSDITGVRKCITGERCLLGIFPGMSQEKPSPFIPCGKK